jgi:hypothetical protein
MQFPVPQNIAMEDRIIGPLTPIQFTITVVGGFISFFVFQSTFLPSFISHGLGILAAVLTVVLAVGKFNDQPMYRFIRAIVSFVTSPKIRIWHKAGMEPILVKPRPVEHKKEEKSLNKRVSKQDIAQLAAVLDSRGQSGVLPASSQNPES